MVADMGAGGENLAPMALPVLGGLLISDEIVHLSLPDRLRCVRRARWLKLHGRADTGTSPIQRRQLQHSDLHLRYDPAVA